MLRPLDTRRRVIDIAAAGVFFVFCLVFMLWQGNFASYVPGFGIVSQLTVLAAVVVTAVFSIALALRRQSPAVALAVAWLAAIAQMGLGMPPLIANLAILGILYTSAAYGTRLVFWLGFASSFLGAAAVTLYLIVPPLVRGGWGLSSAIEQFLRTGILLYVAAALAFLLSWTVGALVRSTLRARENRRAQEQAEAETVAEQERTRIARDMHDVVAHSLAVVIAQADGGRYAAASDPSAATDALGTISTTARSALADVRLLLTQLRHSQADGPQPTLADLEQLYAQVRAAGVDLRIDVDPTPPGEPPAAVQLAVYRILQEALTNALRHGDGGPVTVSLAWHPDHVFLCVRNAAGAGDAAGDRGHGIIGMRERAQLAGGTLDAGFEDAGFVVRATLPLGGDDR